MDVQVHHMMMSHLPIANQIAISKFALCFALPPLTTTKSLVTTLGMIIMNVSRHLISTLPYIAPTPVVPEGCSRNGISRLQVLWPGYILSRQQQSLSCSPSAERTEFCVTGTSHTEEEWRKPIAITQIQLCITKVMPKPCHFIALGYSPIQSIAF